MEFNETLEKLELEVEIMRYQILLFGISEKKKRTLAETKSIHLKLKEAYENRDDN